jgi:hypothetical protein
MKMLAINCRKLVKECPSVWHRAKTVSAGSSIPIAVMAYLRAERVKRAEATDMEQEKRSKRVKRANLSCILCKEMEEFCLALTPVCDYFGTF